MTHYIAKFKDGTVAEIKNSSKKYGAAYRIGVKWMPKSVHPRETQQPDKDGYLVSYKQGFSRDRDLANKAAMSETSALRSGRYYASRPASEHNMISKGGVPGEVIFIEIVDLIVGGGA